MFFWAGVARIDDVYFQNQSEKVKLDSYVQTEFWPTVVSGIGYLRIQVCCLPKIS